MRFLLIALWLGPVIPSQVPVTVPACHVRAVYRDDDAPAVHMVCADGSSWTVEVS